MTAKNTLCALVAGLFLSSCSQWDKGPTAPAAAPEAAHAAAPTPSALLQKAYVDNWCATTTALPLEVQSTVKQIRESVLRQTKTPPVFADLHTECAWIAMQVDTQGELDLGASLGVAPAGEIDLRPVATFSFLRKLSLKGQNVRPAMLSVLKTLTGLEELDLSGNPQLNASALEIVGLFPHLTSLSMNECQLNDIINLRFGGLEKLLHLSLNGNDLPGTPFSMPDSLNSLDLSSNNIQQASEVLVSHLSLLAKLDLSQNDLAEVPRLPLNLSALDLSQNNRILVETAFVTVKRQKTAGQLLKLKEIAVGNPLDAQTVITAADLNKQALGVTLKVGDK